MTDRIDGLSAPISPASLQPDSIEEVQKVVLWALGEGKRLIVEGNGSKRRPGARPTNAETISMRRHSGVVDYQPEELVLTAKAGTSLAYVEELLAQRHQMLAFEPPDLGALLGGAAKNGTLGGTIACNLSGSRRISSGAARDHFLGFQAVNGRGDIFKSGGKVMKNVTGYDLSKLMAGSRGTLAVLSEVSVKVMPAPDAIGTLLLGGLGDAEAIAILCQAMGSAHEVSGAAHLPAEIVRRGDIDALQAMQGAATAVRVEGFEPSVRVRLEALTRMFAGMGRLLTLGTLESRGLWQAICNARPLWRDGDAARKDRELWQLSVPPASGADVVARIRETIPDAEYQYDWSGGLVWLVVPTAKANAGVLRRAISGCGGRAMPLLVPPQASPPPTPGPEQALSRRIRESFDPRGIFV